MSFTSPRSRHTYTWNHFGPALTAATSSIERVLRVESVYGSPARAAAARDRELTLRIGDAREAGGCEDERDGQRAAEQCRRGIDRR